MNKTFKVLTVLTLVPLFCSCSGGGNSSSSTTSSTKSCDHEFNDEIVNPTCTVDGYTKHTCKKMQLFI